MFTGLIETTGTIEAVNSGDKSLIFTIKPNDTTFIVKVGDSVATNGVCLTVEEVYNSSFKVRAVSETVKLTSLRNLKTNSTVNLERAMLASSRFDGHIVQGHVDTTAILNSINTSGDSLLYQFKIEQNYMKYIALKGSITIDGISLTIAKKSNDTFTVTLIPHTIKNTTLQNLKIGSIVNIECDVLARYIENLLNHKENSSSDSQLLSLLERNGF